MPFAMSDAELQRLFLRPSAFFVDFGAEGCEGKYSIEMAYCP